MKINHEKYQVWITEYPLNGNDGSSKYDPGFQLVGTFKTIEEAVECHRKHDGQAPVITKLVTWETKIDDVTDGHQLLRGGTQSVNPLTFGNKS